jgi:hypothetical protein
VYAFSSELGKRGDHPCLHQHSSVTLGARDDGDGTGGLFLDARLRGLEEPGEQGDAVVDVESDNLCAELVFRQELSDGGQCLAPLDGAADPDPGEEILEVERLLTYAGLGAGPDGDNGLGRRGHPGRSHLLELLHVCIKLAAQVVQVAPQTKPSTLV